MPALRPSLEGALHRWRSNLIDLSRRNPLLALKSLSGAQLQIVQPGLNEIFDYLVRGGKPWRFHLPAEKTKRGVEAQRPWPDELVTTESDRVQVVQVLTNLYRRAR